MNIDLTPLEARVIGSLIEKQITTPEQYPLSLNALTSACNQRSNRDPVLDLSESEVQRVVDGLIAARQVSEQSSGYGSRVAKYQQRFCNSDFGLLQFSQQELALVCELLLRGPQTPGELRSRASRLCRFADVGEVESVLDSLARREDGPFVARLPREPGRRESRYTHLFGRHGEEDGTDAQPLAEDEGADVADSRLCLLEERVAELEAEVTALRRLLEDMGGKTS